MSNGRRSQVGNAYRSGYLHSGAWFARRDRWFRDETAKHATVRCIVTGAIGGRHDFQLHHLDYARVRFTNNRWEAGESHDDLVAMRPDVHEAIHQLLDRDRVLRLHRTRRTANLAAIGILRRRIAKALDNTNGSDS